MPTTSRIRRFAAAAFVAVACAAPAAAQITFTWTGNEATMNPRIVRDGNPSSHLNPPKAFPGLTSSGDFLYRVFAFTNGSAVARPFYVDAIAGEGDILQRNIFIVAYRGAFNPSNLAENYLGDAGVSCNTLLCGSGGDFSILLGAGETVVLNLHRVNSGTAPGGSFTFSAGFDAPSVVPEPSTYALTAAGLAGLGVIARRRRST